MLNGSLSAPRITMTIGELQGWSIHWEVKFDCETIRFSDGLVFGGVFGVRGTVSLIEKRRLLNLRKSSIGICSIHKSIDNKHVENIHVEIFYSKEELEKISSLLISGRPFNKFCMKHDDIFCVDENGNTLPTGSLYWHLSGQKECGMDFSEFDQFCFESHYPESSE